MTNSKICPICNGEVAIQHMPAIDKATGKLAHDYCCRIESPEQFSKRRCDHMARAAQATMRLIEDVAKKHGISL